MSTIETYITIHDQDLVLECEAAGTFKMSHTYMFVGGRPVDRLPSGLKVVVCRNYVPNYERFPQFYDFTGWFVLARHGLIDTDHIMCIQDDMAVVDPMLVGRCVSMLDQGPGMVSFTPGHHSAGNWMLGIDGFAATYNAGVEAVGADPSSFPAFEEWPTTQGSAWRRHDMEAFMEWFEPLFERWAPNVWAGHLAERSPWAWMMSSDLPGRYLRGVITHEARDRHGTGALMSGSYNVYAERAQTFGH